MNNINNVSNPKKVYQNLINYLKLNKLDINNYTLFLSSKINKKYMLYDKLNNKYIHFGDIRYEDFTKNNDKIRQNNYLNRAQNIKGNWKINPLSPNNLSINLLW